MNKPIALLGSPAPRPSPDPVEHLRWLERRRGEAPRRPTILLHSCCGPCSTAPLERLVAVADIAVYFYNPNIHPRQEYLRREQGQRSVISRFNKQHPEKIAFLAGAYKPHHFFEVASPHASAPEGGVRCQHCYTLRLQATAELAATLAFDYFATTLTVSPYKDSDRLTLIALQAEADHGVAAFTANFKKQGGYQRTLQWSKALGLTRQAYCGCIYSKHTADARQLARVALQESLSDPPPARVDSTHAS